MSLMKKLDKINSVFHRGDRSTSNAQSGSNKDPTAPSTHSAAGINLSPSSLGSHAVAERRMPSSPPSPENDANLQKRIEVMGRSLARLSRKITRYINNAQQASNTDTNEKRLAKMNENSLAINFREECQQLENVARERAANSGTVGANFGVCLAAVLKSCEDCYCYIAQHRLGADQKVEVVIVYKLEAIAAELANCETDRKRLEKMQKELASDESKLQQAEKSLAASLSNAGAASTPATSAGSVGALVYNISSGFSAGQAQAVAAQLQQQPSALESKVVSMRNDADEKRAKVEQHRDFLMANMYTLLSKEKEISKLFAQLLKFTAEYHKQALEHINATLPEIEATLNHHPCSPCYGADLEQHLQVSGREIALPIEACIYTLVKCGGLREEGLFRVAGSASKTRKLKAALDAGVIDMTEYRNDFAVLGDALKSYLRELPNPLLNNQFYNDWMAAGQVKSGADDNSRRNAVGTVLRKLPETYRRNLLYLTAFLARLSDEAASNKMNITNLAIVVGPNLLWPPPKTLNPLNTTADNNTFAGGSVGRGAGAAVAAAAAAASSEAMVECMQDAGNIHSVVECLIRYSSYFLSPEDGDIDFSTQPSAVYFPGETITTPDVVPVLTSSAGSTTNVAQNLQQPQPLPQPRLYPALASNNSAQTPVAAARTLRNGSSGSSAADQQRQVSASRNSLDYAGNDSNTLRNDPAVALPPSGVHFTAEQQQHYYADSSSDNSSNNNIVRNVSSFRKPTAIPATTPKSIHDDAANSNKRHPPYYNAPPSNHSSVSDTSSRANEVVSAGLPPVSSTSNNNVASDDSTSPKVPRRATTFRKSRPAPPPPVVSNEPTPVSQQRIGVVSSSPQQQPSVRSHIHHHHQRNASAGSLPVVVRASPVAVVPSASRPPPQQQSQLNEVPRAYAEDDDIFSDSSSGHSSGYHQQLSPVFPTLSNMDQTDGGMARDSSLDYHDAQTGFVTPPSPATSAPQQPENNNHSANRFQHQQSTVSLNSVDSSRRPPQRPPAPHTASRTRSPIVEVQPIELSPATPVQAGAAPRYVYNESATASSAAVPTSDSNAVSQPSTPKSLYPSDIVAEAYKSYMPTPAITTTTTTGDFQTLQQFSPPSKPPRSAVTDASYVGAYHQVRRPPNQQSFHVEQDRRQKSSPPRSASAHDKSEEEEIEVDAADNAGADSAAATENRDDAADSAGAGDGSAVPAAYTSSLTRVLASKNLPQRAASSCSSSVSDLKLHGKAGAVEHERKNATDTTLHNGSSNRSVSSHAIDKKTDENAFTNGAVGGAVIKPKILPKPTHLSTTSATPSVSSFISTGSGGRTGSTSSTNSGSSCRSDVVISETTSSSATTPVTSSGLPEALV